MRSNKPILIATVFFAWICITYFLWSRQTSIDQLDNGYKDVYRQLDRLEADVQRELHTNRETLQRLLAVVQGLEKVRSAIALVILFLMNFWVLCVHFV